MATTQDHAPPGACGYSDLAKGRVSVSMLSAGGIIGQRLQHVQQLRHVPQSSPMASASSPPLSSWKLTCSTSARPCRRRTRSLPVRCPDHHLVEQAVPLVGPAPRWGDGLAMRAAAPSPAPTLMQVATQVSPGFVQELPGRSCPSTPSAFSETTMPPRSSSLDLTQCTSRPLVTI